VDVTDIQAYAWITWRMTALKTFGGPARCKAASTRPQRSSLIASGSRVGCQGNSNGKALSCQNAVSR